MFSESVYFVIYLLPLKSLADIRQLVKKIDVLTKIQNTGMAREPMEDIFCDLSMRPVLNISRPTGKPGESKRYSLAAFCRG